MEIISVGLETELRLGLPGGGGCEVEKKEKKRIFSDFCGIEKEVGENKNQIVGWPPVAAYRRKNSFNGGKSYVKVSMDGAPYLRKVDLGGYGGYSELVGALEQLFGSFGIVSGDGGDEKEEESAKSIIYEDKDGDWMLLGDVPWSMFRESCKRLRIMKKIGDVDDDASHQAKDLLKALSNDG